MCVFTNGESESHESDGCIFGSLVVHPRLVLHRFQQLIRPLLRYLIPWTLHQTLNKLKTDWVVFQLLYTEAKLYFAYTCDEIGKRFPQIEHIASEVLVLFKLYKKQHPPNCWKAILLIRIQVKQWMIAIHPTACFTKNFKKRRQLKLFNLPRVEIVHLKSIKPIKRDIPTSS